MSQFGPQYSVLRLRSWPDLGLVGDDVAQDFARVCALLAKRKTAATLIPVMLDIPRERALGIVDYLHVNGHLAATELPSSETSMAAPADALQNPRAMQASSVLGRLWKRLTVHSAP